MQTDNAAMVERQNLIAALWLFVAQRPGLEFGNYGNREAYMADYRRILQAKHDAEKLIGAVSWRHSMSIDDLKKALTSAYSGRLEWDGKALTYTAGQYMPTEYRNAVCACMAQAMRNYWMACYKDYASVKATARKELGKGIASRWF